MGKSADKVTAIAAGEAHTLALTGDGSVFSWGRGTFGRLGTGSDDDELFPVPVYFGDGDTAASSSSSSSANPKFIGIAAGAYHSLALQEDGSVWSWGYNTYGQLGHGEENTSVPTLVERFQELGSPDSLSGEINVNRDKTPLKVCSIKAGGMMSLAIDSIGALWIWGNSPQPSRTKDSKFCLASIPVPVPVWDFHGHTVVKVACGNEHVVAAVSAGEMYTGGDLVCYSWGNNSHGQLGLGNKENRPRPEVIPAFNQDSPWAVYDISCGAFHTAILTQSKSYDQEIDSRCWTFGLGDNGQLGHGSTASINLPQPVEGLPQEVILISVDCGLFHTSVVSVAGEVWSWGMEKGLGLCPDASFTGHDAGDALRPRRILCSQSTGGNFTGPVQVACGAAHTVLLADDGYKIWVWGRGRSGVLGTGQSVDSFVPCVAMWPPLDEDLKEKGESTRIDEMRYRGPTAGQKAEVNDVQLLRDKLAVMERYATVLHVSIFRKPLDERTLPQLLGSGVFDVMRELENMMESADTEELARLEMFYRSMLASVKDKLMRRRVQEMVKDCLVSMSKGRKTY